MAKKRFTEGGPVRVRRLEPLQGTKLRKRHVASRQIGRTGILGERVACHPGLYWVHHAEGGKAPYRLEELAPR